MDYRKIKSIIEGLLFVSGSEGLEAKQLAAILDMEEEEVLDLCYDLQADLNREERGIQMIEVAGAFQLTTRAEHAPYFEKLASHPQHATLSQAALETLAIIAYKQPITRVDIEEIRGVKCEKALNTLLAKRLIRETGRVEGPGRPILYGTTKEFLEYFGIRDLSQLPPIPQFFPTEEWDEETKLLFDRKA